MFNWSARRPCEPTKKESTRDIAARHFCIRAIAALLLTLGVLPGSVQLCAEEPPTRFVERPTWTETMLATRASLNEWRKANHQQPPAGAQPYASGPVSGDGPAQHISISVAGWQWLRLISILERGPGNCHIWGEAKLIAADGSETRLSDLSPVSIHVGWGELLPNKNWRDEPLQIKDRKFTHGIWVHANSDICYEIAGKYERFEAWVGMDAARVGGQARFQVQFDCTDWSAQAWREIARRFPEQSKWFAEDGGTSYLDWFVTGPDTSWEQRLIAQALKPSADDRTGLNEQLQQLKAAGVPREDRRWLDLYVKACRYRICRTSLDRITMIDVRRAVEDELKTLCAVEVPPDDARWPTISQRAEKISSAMPAGLPIEAGQLDKSVRTLAERMPSFPPPDKLLERLARDQSKWMETATAAARGDAPALANIEIVAKEITGFQRELLCALPGMSDFLAKHPLLEREWQQQFASLLGSLDNRQAIQQLAAETLRADSLIAESDRDPADIVLRRTTSLLNDLNRLGAAAELTDAARRLAELKSASAAISPADRVARFVLFSEACRVRRQIALANPLLNFDEIVFIKHHRALMNHMCDQYYGMAAMPGGGLYVLSGAFSDSPQLRDVLDKSVVERGRLKGEKLSGGPPTPSPVSFDGMGNRHGEDRGGGTFLSPDLSFDGKSITFAYVENRGDMNHWHHTDPARGHWAEGRCYHIFKVQADGSQLEQLTDGTWNDFDPCFLPNGRIAFISERRGGYLRCGRVCPTYTLFDMAADGQDITCLSFHETNEWQPSVTNDGQIIWTRWDYVDRHGCTAHMPWLTTLDGRDPRAVHGNFSPRSTRPDMELDCRAVPGSPKFIATAAPHHGQAYGSLILVDPNAKDDDGMGPVRRITPEVGFPETQGGAQVYGTPWALSEDYYLCVYDATMQPNAGMQGRDFQAGNYGIYLVDSFGNRELIYRDPDIGCLSPIPLRSRPMPAAAPSLVRRGPLTNPATRPVQSVGDSLPKATISIMNVYDGMKPWPDGTRITQLRVLQVLPMSVPSGAPPHETALRVATAGDSVVPVRHVLGTVPVESDGSAHFQLPACKEIFFQALDDKGLAVQSMRSATQVQEGDRLVCAGCHDQRSRAAQQSARVPLALQREPSSLQPDVDGSNPFSYPRLVQPVLDRHCVECHARESAKTFALSREPIVRGWYASYSNLIERYAFHDYGDGYRTTPGQFGARASKLYEILEKGHYDVRLSPEEMHRITLWLDCTSMFYGVYEKEGGQAQLRGEVALPTLE